ncbi:unnamed protein product [Caretta caretta]
MDYLSNQLCILGRILHFIQTEHEEGTVIIALQCVKRILCCCYHHHLCVNGREPELVDKIKMIPRLSNLYQ